MCHASPGVRTYNQQLARRTNIFTQQTQNILLETNLLSCPNLLTSFRCLRVHENTRD